MVHQPLVITRWVVAVEVHQPPVIPRWTVDTEAVFHPPAATVPRPPQPSQDGPPLVGTCDQPQCLPCKMGPPLRGETKIKWSSATVGRMPSSSLYAKRDPIQVSFLLDPWAFRLSDCRCSCAIWWAGDGQFQRQCHICSSCRRPNNSMVCSSVFILP